MREEVNQAIGPDQAPSHRFHSNKCPYTMAWIYEMMRHLTPSPLLLPHRTTQQIEFNNCVIPAGVTVYFNVWEVKFLRHIKSQRLLTILLPSNPFYQKDYNDVRLTALLHERFIKRIAILHIQLLLRLSAILKQWNKFLFELPNNDTVDLVSFGNLA